jgi:hypothetical protein
LGQLQSQNANNVAMQGNINSANSGVAQQNAKTQGGILGGLLGGVGSALGLAQGGQVPIPPLSHYQSMSNAQHTAGKYSDGGPVSIVGKHFHSMKSGGHVPGKAQISGDSLKNDTVPAMLSPGEIVVPRTAAKDPSKAASFAKALAMRSKKKGK